MKKQRMKQAWIYIVLLIFVPPLLSLIFGLTSGAADFWKGVPGSIVVGIGMGFFVWLWMMVDNPVKRYHKCIKIVMEKLSQTERETFAGQMLGEDPDIRVREVVWKSLMEGQNEARITRDYLTFSNDRGSFQLVQLWRTERIELDVKDSSYRVRSGGMSIRIADESYPLAFYYRGNQKEESDDSYTFAKRQWRETVLQAIKEVTGENF